MLTTQEYEEIYCTYCDSQRCLNRIGLTISDVCPYWELRQERKNTDKIGGVFWHIVPVGDGYTYLFVDEHNNHFLKRKENEVTDDNKLKFISEKDAQLYIDKNLDSNKYKPEKYWLKTN